MEINGYSDYVIKETQGEAIDNFTLTFQCVPYTYESRVSGIISAFSGKEKQGIIIGVKKRGIVSVRIGLNNMILDIESLQEHLKFQQNNIITVAFWGTAGWCDLYVNHKLSNRKQFPRHGKVSIPSGQYYIGKYVDEIQFYTQTRYGVFHGELNFLAFTREYLDYEKVIAIHKEHENMTIEKINLYKNQDFSNDIYRPVYHLMPPGKWMNEPHAPLFFKGYYHIFYQANPHAPIWDNLCWGHLYSNDMVKWKDAGIALYPDEENLDIDGCWSGSTCMDQDGNPILFYTAGNNKELPNQSVAVARPENIEDMELHSWQKKGTILRQSITEGFLGEFRDPFVWRKQDTYYILVGSGDADNGGGNALLYTTVNLKDFVCHGFVVDYDYDKCHEVGHVWELPVLLPLNNEKGEYCCDILLLCACQIEGEVVETYYFLGKFDYEDNQFHKFHDCPELIDLGNGTFTGPSGLVTPDGRSVIFTIAQGKRDGKDEYWAGWAHNGGMPVQLSIQGNELRIDPISEIRKYFSLCLSTNIICAEDFGKVVFQQKNLLENRILVMSQGECLELIFEEEEDTCTISYNRSSKEWKAVSREKGKMISKIRNEQDLIYIGQEEIRMECYVDHSLIEIYLNGRKSMSLRNYAFCENNTFYVRTDNTCTVSVWGYDENAN